MGSSPQQFSPAQINQIARAAIKQQSVKMSQPIFNGAFVPSNTPNYTVIPRNVGLIKGFYVQVTHTVSNGSGVQIDLTDFGPANALNQIQFNDLNGVTRIQCPGWYLAFVNAVKARRPFGSSLVRTTGFDSPINFGSNFGGQISAPATIASMGTGTVTMWYWVPLAYGDDDLRGSIYANVLNATMQLILTFPTQCNICVANGADSTLSMYVGHAAGSVASVSITNTVINVQQVYFDQLPKTKDGAVLLPVTDLGTIYGLGQTSLSAITAAQDFPYQYANFRDFLSTTGVYVNTASTGARGTGADINYLALQSANFTNIWKKTPALIALETRNNLGVDMPPGVYYFPSRERTISTNQYGNMQLVLNAATANTGAYLLVGVEYFALIQQISMAGSLSAS